jgi:hypothetical protein
MLATYGKINYNNVNEKKLYIKIKENDNITSETLEGFYLF